MWKWQYFFANLFWCCHWSNLFFVSPYCQPALIIQTWVNLSNDQIRKLATNYNKWKWSWLTCTFIDFVWEETEFEAVDLTVYTNLWMYCPCRRYWWWRWWWWQGGCLQRFRKLGHWLLLHPQSDSLFSVSWGVHRVHHQEQGSRYPHHDAECIHVSGLYSL